MASRLAGFLGRMCADVDREPAKLEGAVLHLLEHLSTGEPDAPPFALLALVNVTAQLALVIGLSPDDIGELQTLIAERVAEDPDYLELRRSVIAAAIAEVAES